MACPRHRVRLMGFFRQLPNIVPLAGASRPASIRDRPPGSTSPIPISEPRARPSDGSPRDGHGSTNSGFTADEELAKLSRFRGSCRFAPGLARSGLCAGLAGGGGVPARASRLSARRLGCRAWRCTRSGQQAVVGGEFHGFVVEGQLLDGAGGSAAGRAGAAGLRAEPSAAGTCHLGWRSSPIRSDRSWRTGCRAGRRGTA